MAPSSSGSWSAGGGGGGAPGDIIDLDRYMRGSVRPSTPRSGDAKFGRLVVDGGGVRDVGGAGGAWGGGASSRSSASGDARARHKRASHDSGVSDGSYRRPTPHHAYHSRQHDYYPRPRSRPRARPRAPHEPALTSTLSGRPPSSSSLHAFRTVCEQALLDQQRQIARVAELCEKLTERAEKTDHVETHSTDERAQRTQRPAAAERARAKRAERTTHELHALSDVSSQISSSSRSTKLLRRKGEKYQQQECKTYKIIMSKLDELSRLFAPRAAALTHAPAPRAPHPRALPSDTSVSVCDKLVATDPQRTYNKILAPSYQRMRSAGACSRGAVPSSPPAAHSPRIVSARTVTQAFAVDIAPRDVRNRTNVVTESVNKCESSSSSSHRSACDPRCGFDLDDPVHLYSQAKRLRSTAASSRSRRAHSADSAAEAGAMAGVGAGAGDKAWLGAHVREHVRERSCSRTGSVSLCAVCRGYWRYLRRCVPPLLDSCKCS